MDKMADAYSRRYEIDFDKGVYDKIAESDQLKKIYGKAGDSILIRGDSENLLLIERDFNKKKEIIKIHSKDLDTIQSQLENISRLNLSQYKKD